MTADSVLFFEPIAIADGVTDTLGLPDRERASHFDRRGAAPCGRLAYEAARGAYLEGRWLRREGQRIRLAERAERRRLAHEQRKRRDVPMEADRHEA